MKTTAKFVSSLITAFLVVTLILVSCKKPDRVEAHDTSVEKLFTGNKSKSWRMTINSTEGISSLSACNDDDVYTFDTPIHQKTIIDIDSTLIVNKKIIGYDTVNVNPLEVDTLYKLDSTYKLTYFYNYWSSAKLNYNPGSSTCGPDDQIYTKTIVFDTLKITHYNPNDPQKIDSISTHPLYIDGSIMYEFKYASAGKIVLKEYAPFGGVAKREIEFRNP